VLIDILKCFEVLLFVYSLWLKRGKSGRRVNSKNPQATLNTRVKSLTNKKPISATKNKGVRHKRMAKSGSG
jgi:hypothetical protein